MQRPVRTIKRPIYFGDIQHESHVKKPRNRNKTQNTPVQRHSQRTNTSSIEEQPGPSNQTSNVVVPRKTGPKLRRSCVMEAFSTFFFKKATSPKFKSSRKSEYNQSSTHYIGGKDLWNISVSFLNNLKLHLHFSHTLLCKYVFVNFLNSFIKINVINLFILVGQSIFCILLSTMHQKSELTIVKPISLQHRSIHYSILFWIWSTCEQQGNESFIR